VVGHDPRFGRGNAGDVETMRALGELYGFAVEVVDDACAISESGRRWSSTWVRELLEKGDLPAAAEVLGRPHRLRGRVVHGDKLGREIGFPTANIEVTDGMIPRHGVYAGWLTVVDAVTNVGASRLVGERLPAAVSLGLNYTVGGTDLRVEAFVIDRDGLPLYDTEVTLDLVKWRRPMLDFGSLDALVAALTEDVEWCRSVLA
jgi:riboflavin kinase/FMN adenylyltransferase